MINLKNMGPTKFREYIKDKQIVIFGAGRALDSCLDIYFENANVLFVVDNNEKLWNTAHRFNDKLYMIFSVKELVEAYKANDKLICYINSPFYAKEIVEQLDSIPELDGLECYLSVVMRNTIEEIKPWEFTKGPQRIPKKIHYIWVGGKELPDEFKKNIDTWRKFNPDYEIVRWDESNYDFRKDWYTKNAYEMEEWGFVVNLSRLDIIYEEGGIYLDTDVEVKKNFDTLLKDNAFFNMGKTCLVNRGCGFGAYKHHEIIKDMMEPFFRMEEINNRWIKKQDHTFCHPVLRKYGFKIKNEYQNINNIALYPTEVMSPLTSEGMDNYLSDKTLSIHKENGTWKSENEQITPLKKLIKRL